MRKPRESHGHTNARRQTAEYRVWRDMFTRCSNPNAASFKNYGARGIRVCERWNVFSAFLADLGPRPSPRHSLDRRDNDGPYEPGNCFWATRREQARNRRSTHPLTFRGETRSIIEWAEQLNIAVDVLRKRVRLGWPTERILTAPVDTRYQRSRIRA